MKYMLPVAAVLTGGAVVGAAVVTGDVTGLVTAIENIYIYQLVTCFQRCDYFSLRSPVFLLAQSAVFIEAGDEERNNQTSGTRVPIGK